MRFPRVTLADMVCAQVALVDALGIDTLHAVAGGCMGGSHALLWGIRHPGRAERIIAISVRPETTPSSIALWSVVRQAIRSDPDWRGGDYYGKAYPRRGVGLANMISLLHLIDDGQFNARYGRNRLTRRSEDPCAPTFLVEHMMDRVGAAQNVAIDPNSLLLLTQAVAGHDLGEGHVSLADALNGAAGRFLLVSYQRDRRYSPADTERLAVALHEAGVWVEHVTLDNPISHSAYQYDVSDLEVPVGVFLGRVNLPPDYSKDLPVA